MSAIKRSSNTQELLVLQMAIIALALFCGDATSWKHMYCRFTSALLEAPGVVAVAAAVVLQPVVTNFLGRWMEGLEVPLVRELAFCLAIWPTVPWFRGGLALLREH